MKGSEMIWNITACASSEVALISPISSVRAEKIEASNTIAAPIGAPSRQSSRKATLSKRHGPATRR